MNTTTNTANLDHIQDIFDDFEYMTEWEDKYTYIIDMGKNLEPIDDTYKTEEYKVKGCMSQVWLVLDHNKTKEAESTHKVYFKADSDAIIVKGLVALLLKIYSGQKRDNIKNINIEQIFDKLGLSSHLSPIRRNGFYSMVEKIKAYTT